MSVLAVYQQDPDDKLDYTIDWVPFLGGTVAAPSDTIATSVWVAPTGITEGTPASTKTDTTTTAWLSAGTRGDYIVKNKITTTGGRIREESILVRVRAN